MVGIGLSCLGSIGKGSKANAATRHASD
jgi:hypothetical protein